jgi:hypothetical protein
MVRAHVAADAASMMTPLVMVEALKLKNHVLLPVLSVNL